MADHASTAGGRFPVMSESVVVRCASRLAMPVSVVVRPASIPIMPVSVVACPASILVMPVSAVACPASILVMPVSVVACRASIPAMPVSVVPCRASVGSRWASIPTISAPVFTFSATPQPPRAARRAHKGTPRGHGTHLTQRASLLAEPHSLEPKTIGYTTVTMPPAGFGNERFWNARTTHRTTL